ncbi:MAG: tetratricopeptide repeat protein [Ignavibacteria bacterium]|nr:tetratricopeptide repeat protein [Ignavibacteria bacterium]
MNFQKIDLIKEKFFNSKLSPLIVLSLITFFIYFHTLSFDFTSLDDYELIVNKYHILKDYKNIPTLFKTNILMSESGIYYRPIVSLSFMIDTIIGGKDAFVSHFSNVVYHIIAVILFFVLFGRIARSRAIAFWFSLLFAIHPALVQAVCWIPGRNDSLLFIFLSLTLIFFEKSFLLSNDFRLKKQLLMILSGFSFLFALLTKENAFLILIFVVLYPVVLKFSNVERKYKLQWFVTFLIFSSIYLVLRSQANLQKLEIEQLPLNTFDYIKGFVNYFGKIFIPINLSVITLTENINLIYGFISILLFIGLSLMGIKNLKIYLYGLAWFMIFLISGFVGLIGFTNFLDHRIYVPMFGIFLSISQLVFIEKVSKRFFYPVIVLILFLFSYLNITHSINFKEPFTFYSSAVKDAPNSFFVQRGLANVYHRLKFYDKAEEHFRKSYELNPNSVETLVNFGINFSKQGKLDSAEFYFLRALKINPNNSIIYNNLGNLYLQKNDLTQAEYYLKKAIELNTNYFEAYNNLGVLYARLGKKILAYKNFHKAIEINKEFAQGYFNLALLFYNNGQLDSSKHYYLKSLEKGFPAPNILTDKLN